MAGFFVRKLEGAGIWSPLRGLWLKQYAVSVFQD